MNHNDAVITLKNAGREVTVVVLREITDEDAIESALQVSFIAMLHALCFTIPLNASQCVAFCCMVLHCIALCCIVLHQFISLSDLPYTYHSYYLFVVLVKLCGIVHSINIYL